MLLIYLSLSSRLPPGSNKILTRDKSRNSWPGRFLFLDVNQYYLVKGDSDDDTRCDETSCDTTLAEKSKVSPVRCCSDTQISGWRKKSSCSVWAASNIWGKCKNLNWDDANTFCISQGGRLCTKDELEASCAEETGCEFDYRRVWSSTTGKSK